ncbi:unnamed protein product [Staurois parvus]|uniref:Uncharacterized protein n=1 Tax=Staurois parvus TaxID=386267 RepID=A0ABN9CEQ0_9NEOB|nr:unnamed protein product [Staurois parvus]
MHPSYQPFIVPLPSLPIPPLASTQCPPPLSANPFTGLHSVPSTPLCQSLHWPPLSVLHPSLPIPPLASTHCPPPLSANPSTGWRLRNELNSKYRQLTKPSKLHHQPYPKISPIHSTLPKTLQLPCRLLSC